MIADADRVDLCAHLLDHAGRLVSKIIGSG